MAIVLHLDFSSGAIYPFDARGVARRLLYAAVLGVLGVLNPGEAMRCVDDHEPLPLPEQLKFVAPRRARK